MCRKEYALYEPAYDALDRNHCSQRTCFYWIINSVLSYVQHKVLNIKYKNDKEEKEVAKVGNKGSKDSR